MRSLDRGQTWEETFDGGIYDVLYAVPLGLPTSGGAIVVCIDGLAGRAGGERGPGGDVHERDV